MDFEIRCASGCFDQEYLDKLTEAGYRVYQVIPEDEFSRWIISIPDDFGIMGIVDLSSILGQEIIIRTKSNDKYLEYDRITIYDDYVE